MATKTTKKTTKKPVVKKAIPAKEMGSKCCFTSGCLNFYGCYAHGIKRYLKPFDAEIVQLRKELAIAREERVTLKKPCTFSQLCANEI